MRQVSSGITGYFEDFRTEEDIDVWLYALKGHLMNYIAGVESMNVEAELIFTGE